MNTTEFIEYAKDMYDLEQQDIDARNRSRQKENADNHIEKILETLDYFGLKETGDLIFDENGYLKLENLLLERSIHNNNSFYIRRLYCSKCGAEYSETIRSIISSVEDLGKHLNFICYDCKHPKPEKPQEREDLDIAKSYINTEEQRFWYYLIKSIINEIQRF